MKKNCVTCHFLAKKVRNKIGLGKIDYSIHTKPWISRDRVLRRVESDMFFAVRGVQCFRDVWEHRLIGHYDVDSLEDVLLKITITKNRGDSCYFFEYNKNMNLEGGVELEKRNAQNGQLKRSHLYTQIGLYISGGALVADLLLTHWSSIVNGWTSVMATWHNWINDIVVFYALIIKGIL